MQQNTEVKRSITKVNTEVFIPVQGLNTLAINLTGTFTATTVFEYTINGEDWYTLTAFTIDTATPATGSTAVGKWTVGVSAFQKVRVRCSAFTSGSIEVYLRAITNGSASSAGTTIPATVSSANTPSIVTSAGNALAANTSRKGWMIQNVGTNPIFVRLAASASSSVFHVVLKGGSGDSDGLGASYEQMSGVIYTGIVSVAGTTPKFVVTEL